MKFGINVKNKLTGAGLYTDIFQISSILPIFYLFAASGYQGIYMKKGFLSTLFDLGMSALPRAELFGLSLLYRLTSSELAVNFALLLTALAFGFAAKKLFAPAARTAKAARAVCAALIAADIIVRALPVHMNGTFGVIPAIAGTAVRVFCLLLLVMDLRAAKNEPAAENITR